MLSGLVVQLVLLVDRPTLPLNPFEPVTVMVDVPDAPAFTVTLAGLAVIVKSWTTNTIVTECDRPLLVPVVVT